jgi:hypothetical protein
VQVSKIEKKINKMAPLETTVTCKSQMTTFNTETVETKPAPTIGDDFVNTVNFFHNFRKPELDGKLSKATSRNSNDDDKDLSQENKDETGGDFEEVYQLTNNHPTSHLRRKTIRICRHKLQRRTGCNHRSEKKQLKP